MVPTPNFLAGLLPAIIDPNAPRFAVMPAYGRYGENLPPVKAQTLANFKKKHRRISLAYAQRNTTVKRCMTARLNLELRLPVWIAYEFA